MTTTSFESTTETCWRHGNPQRLEMLRVPTLEGDNAPFLLQRTAAHAWFAMRAAAETDGVKLRARSSWRSEDEQRALFTEWTRQKTIPRHKRHGIGLAPSVAEPGHSNHQSGLCVDVELKGQGALAPEFGWLMAHGGKFGWSPTVRGEPWHWEFIGLGGCA